MSGRQMLAEVRRQTVAGILLANAVGAAVVICFAIFALPRPVGVVTTSVTDVNVAAAIVYALVALAVGSWWGRQRIEYGDAGFGGWISHGRAPSQQERALALRAPGRIMVVQAVLWGIAVVGFAVLDAQFSGLLALGVALTVALGGVTTSAAAYLLAERALRPITSLALAADDREPGRVPQLATRWLLSWALGTGVPVLGLLLVGVVVLTPVPVSATTLAVTTVTLASIGLVFGATVTVLAANATVTPVTAIRDGLARVRAGDLDIKLEVWDTTELGLLQAGFNEMVGGLRDRERIRDLFGRQVGADVARQAIEADVRLGGERREVAVLFVDLAGSTRLASDHDPEEVVVLLNRFFVDVVDVVEQAGGSINKFEGDAALAVFGAPLVMDDAASCALRAARVLDAQLRDHVGELQAGIGVAIGPVVAGNIGAEQRYEYTVIGDPVNQAARLSDLAKQHDQRVLATGAILEQATSEESENWKVIDEVTLRGRTQPTKIATPNQLKTTRTE